MWGFRGLGVGFRGSFGGLGFRGSGFGVWGFRCLGFGVSGRGLGV